MTHDHDESPDRVLKWLGVTLAAAATLALVGLIVCGVTAAAAVTYRFAAPIFSGG